MEDWNIFVIMREVVLWSSPVVFLLGITLMLYSRYRNFETLMSREYGLRKRIFPKIEQNIYTFHEWCLNKRTLLGLICVIYAVAVLLTVRKLPFPVEIEGELY